MVQRKILRKENMNDTLRFDRKISDGQLDQIPKIFHSLENIFHFILNEIKTDEV